MPYDVNRKHGIWVIYIYGLHRRNVLPPIHDREIPLGGNFTLPRWLQTGVKKGGYMRVNYGTPCICTYAFTCVLTISFRTYRLIVCDTDSDSFDGVAAAKYTGSDVTDDAILPVSCDVKSSLTRATVVVDVQWFDLTSAHRVAILRRFAEHLQLPASHISLLPAENAIEVGRYKIICSKRHYSSK